jgi:TRAP-type C4-dicarboxylate transport system substrate-binding protein
MRRAVIAGLVGAWLAAGGAASHAAAQEVTLTVHHFLPPRSSAQVGMIEEWASRVEEQSEGRIAVEIFPSMSMGGSPPELYNQVRDGAADIVWTVLGYTPGVFPRAEVFELPSVHRGSALATTKAMNASMDWLAEDFADVHVIFLHSHDGNVLHSATEEVTGLEQLAGKKLRTPSRTGAWMIESWGAEPVGMPVPDLPQALAKGGVDGALVPYEIVPALKLQELEKATTELPNGDRFGTATFMFAMNKDRYGSLPDALRQVIDDNSGMAAAEWVGHAWEDAFEDRGRRALDKAGVTRITLDEAEAAKFAAAAEEVVARWVDEADSKGLDGQALVDRAREAVKAASE